MHIAMLTHHQAQGLDTMGPLEVFGIANQQLIDDGLRHQPAYRMSLIARQAGPVRLSSGIQIIADYAYKDAPDDIHTLLVSGGMGDSMEVERHDRQLVTWLKQRSQNLPRLASICNGALLLAECGILNQRSATTHWRDVAELRQRYPGVRVVDDAIYVHDGHIWTSAGITAGMDLALALVAEDHGQALALKVAKRMVLFMKRSGGQKQFSQFLNQQIHSDRFADLIDWLERHYQNKITIAMMASRVNMSERNFSRRFREEYGLPPSRFLDNLRIEAAKGLLENSTQSLNQIARCVGFGNEETMRRTFARQLKVKPAEYRQRFSSPAATSAQTGSSLG